MVKLRGAQRSLHLASFRSTMRVVFDAPQVTCRSGKESKSRLKVLEAMSVRCDPVGDSRTV